MDSFTSPPTLPEVGLDGLVSEITDNYFFSNTDTFSSLLHCLSHMVKNTSLRPSSIPDFISSSLTQARLWALEVFGFSCKNQLGGLE